jgi:hypothetical protein
LGGRLSLTLETLSIIPDYTPILLEVVRNNFWS